VTPRRGSRCASSCINPTARPPEIGDSTAGHRPAVATEYIRRTRRPQPRPGQRPHAGAPPRVPSAGSLSRGSTRASGRGREGRNRLSPNEKTAPDVPKPPRSPRSDDGVSDPAPASPGFGMSPRSLRRGAGAQRRAGAGAFGGVPVAVELRWAAGSWRIARRH
jgi:hypothetical protein